MPTPSLREAAGRGELVEADGVLLVVRPDDERDGLASSVGGPAGGGIVDQVDEGACGVAGTLARQRGQDRGGESHRGADRTRIVEATARVLREEGIGADMRRIAAASGVGVGTLYRHFPTRDDLLRAVTGTDVAALADTGLPAEGTAAEAVRAFFADAVAQLVANKAMIDVLTGGSPADGDLARCITHLTRVGREAVGRARDDHTLAADVTPGDIAYQLLGLVRIVQLLPDATPTALARQVDLAVRALAPPGAPDHRPNRPRSRRR